MKRLFALLLIVAMIVSMAACAPADDVTPTGGTTEGTQAPAATTTVPTTTEPEDDWSSMDLTGIVADDVITIGIQTNATVLDYDDNHLTKYLEELTGLDIKFSFFSSDAAEAQQQLALMIANNEQLPDVLFGILNDALVAEYGRDGILADQTEWISKAYNFGRHLAVMSDFETNHLWSRLKDGVTGEIYSYPAAQYKQSNDNNEWLGAISSTMAKNVGMDATQIDTIDEVYQYLTKAIKEDGNKNGEADEIGLIYRQGGYRTNAELWIINAYIYCNDSYLFNLENGELYLPYNTDEYRQAMITMNKWYSEGLISPLAYSIQDNAEAKALIDVGAGNYKVVAWGYHPSLCCSSDSRIGEDYTSMLCLADETGKGGYATLRDPYTLGRSATIPVNEKEPERMELAFRFCDLFADWEVAQRLRYGVEGVNWEYVDGKAEGLKDSNDRWAGWRVINDTWSTETKDTWHTCPIGVIAEFAYDAGIVRGGQPQKDITGTLTAISKGCTNNKNAVGMPDEFVYDLVYNEEETGVMTEYKTLYKDFVLASRAQMVTGVIDPNDDAQWNKYLSELKANGEAELLEAAQSAFDRSNG